MSPGPMLDAQSGLSFRLDGRQGAPWLVLSNSIASDLTLWDGVVKRLADHFRILRYDAPGHGNSPISPGRETLEKLADQVAELMAAQEISAAHLGGVSMGAMTLAQLALRHPGRALSLTYCNAIAEANPSYKAIWDDRIASVSAADMAAIADETLQRWLAPNADVSTREAARAMIVATQRGGFCEAARALKGLALFPALERLKCPVVFVAGQLDVAAHPQAMCAIAGRVPGAEFVEIAGAAHLSPMDRPEEVADQIAHAASVHLV